MDKQIIKIYCGNCFNIKVDIVSAYVKVPNLDVEMGVRKGFQSKLNFHERKKNAKK